MILIYNRVNDPLSVSTTLLHYRLVFFFHDYVCCHNRTLLCKLRNFISEDSSQYRFHWKYQKLCDKFVKTMA